MQVGFVRVIDKLILLVKPADQVPLELLIVAHALFIHLGEPC